MIRLYNYYLISILISLRQCRLYEEKNKVSFSEKIFENFKLMLKHFESNRSSLKIEYANGEVVQVVSKVNLKPSTSEIL